MTYFKTNVIDATEIFELKKTKTLGEAINGILACHPDTQDKLGHLLPGYKIIPLSHLDKNKLYVFDYKEYIGPGPIRSKYKK